MNTRNKFEETGLTPDTKWYAMLAFRRTSGLLSANTDPKGKKHKRKMKAVFWEVAPCSLIETVGNFKSVYWFHLHGGK